MTKDLVGIFESLERLEKENWGKLVWESPGPTLILKTCCGKHELKFSMRHKKLPQLQGDAFAGSCNPMRFASE